MADLNKDAVRVANDGRVFWAPVDSEAELPTTWEANADWGAEWASLGLFNEDGVEHSLEDDTEDLLTWQRGAVRVTTTNRELTLTLVAMESSVRVLEMFYDTTITSTGTSASIVIPHATPRSQYKFGFEWYDKLGDSTWRLYIPVGSVGEVESPTFNKQGAVTWGMTIRAMTSDEDYLARWDTNDPQVLAQLGS